MATNKGGRPSKYKAEYADIAEKLCFRGFTIEELATTLDVGTATIKRWAKAHEKFRSALKARESADALVVNSLYKTALSGNTTAQIFWLKNRDPKHWRDKQEIDLTGDVALFKTKSLKDRSKKED